MRAGLCGTPRAAAGESSDAVGEQHSSDDEGAGEGSNLTPAP